MCPLPTPGAAGPRPCRSNFAAGIVTACCTWATRRRTGRPSARPAAPDDDGGPDGRGRRGVAAGARASTEGLPPGAADLPPEENPYQSPAQYGRFAPYGSTDGGKALASLVLGVLGLLLSLFVCCPFVSLLTIPLAAWD